MAAREYSKVEIGRGKAMAIDFRTQSIGIPKGTGQRIIRGSVTFGSRVNRAAVALNGYKLDYITDDHHINIVEVATDFLSIDGNTVNFHVVCTYADRNFDDPYAGYITVLVTADVT